MAMSKKHYIAISEIIRECTSDGNCVSKDMLTSRLSSLFMQDNYAFDSATFRAACYQHDQED